MKVVMISLFKPGSGGGSGRVAHELTHAFAQHHETALIRPADRTGLQATENGLTIFGIRSAGQDEVWVPSLSAKNVGAITDFLDEFEPDVIHAHEPVSISIIAQIWAKMHHVPFVHTSHILPDKILDFGTVDALDVKLLQTTLSETVAHQLLSNFYKNCDAIIALNRYAEEALRNFGYKGRIFIIPNGRDLSRYTQCEQPDIEAEEKILSFIGYIVPRKNQAYLIEALRHLPSHYTLQLVGKALKPAYGAKLRDLCQTHQLDNVVFTGHVEHDNVPPHLARSHVFVSASKMEVQSLVVIEALASGTPVVGLANETIDELVDDAVGRRLPEDAEPPAFAEAVEQICTLDPAGYGEMCQQAEARVSDLDWPNIVHKTVDAYRTLIEVKEEIPAEKPKSQLSAQLKDLLDHFPAGEGKASLADKIRAWEEEHGDRTFLQKLAIASKLRALRRVPGSTWLLAGLTIVISFVGYVFMKLTYFRQSDA
ncbi:MAG: glycosyltransferase [Chloroflexi bacterium]|jgi:glycosyltransferase involved in cell wall biosynthesis|nr:glycosyltransferase [Chloroflexota bacterium]